MDKIADLGKKRTRAETGWASGAQEGFRRLLTSGHWAGSEEAAGLREAGPVHWILGRGKRGSGSGGVYGHAEAQHRDAEDAGTRSSPLLEQKERPRCSCS